MSIEKVKEQIDNIKLKKSNVLFFTPDTSSPSALVYEIFYHAHLMKREGFNVKIVVDDDNLERPYWIEEDLLDVELVLDNKINMSVSASDMIIIPELLTNVFEQTKNLPSIRIGFLQSIDYMLNGLIMGYDWSNFGIKNIITTSEKLSSIVGNFMSGKYNIKHYDIGIPSYFTNRVKNKKPVISMIYRNQSEINKVVKIFYLKYPHYRWVKFDGMLYDDSVKKLSRIDFAKRLDESFAVVWLDRLASFGTLPIEALKCKTVPICLNPDIQHDYLNDVFSTDNIYEIPDMIAKTLTMYLEDNEELETYLNELDYENKYTQKKSSKEIVNIYNEILNSRMISLEDYINNYKEDEE